MPRSLVAKPSLILFVLFFSLNARAHEGHVHAEAPTDGSGEFTGIIKITEQGKRNLGIRVKEVEIAEIEKTLETIVEIVPVPSRVGVLSSRIPGRVKEIYAVGGKLLSAGDPMVLIESYKPGEPPPSVVYNAPISGKVALWMAEIGESVEPNRHLAKVIDLSEVYAEITLFESQLKEVEIGQSVRVYVESFPGELFEGKIELMNDKLDPETRTLKAFASIKNVDLKLRPHMRGTAHVVVDAMDAAIAVPHRAITGDPGNLMTFVQMDEEGLEYEQRSIVVGARDDLVTEVIEGVLPGERVVVSGNYQLQFVERKKSDGEPQEDEGHGHGHNEESEHVHSMEASKSGGSLLSLPVQFGLLALLAVSMVINFSYAYRMNRVERVLGEMYSKK